MIGRPWRVGVHVVHFPVGAGEHEYMLESWKQRVVDADLPDPVFALLGAADLAMKAPWAASRYYNDLVERGHDRLVKVGTQRAVRRKVSNRMENRASQLAVKYKQRQRRQRRSA